MSNTEIHSLVDFLGILKGVLQREESVGELDAWWHTECDSLESEDSEVEMAIFLHDLVFYEVPPHQPSALQNPQASFLNAYIDEEQREVSHRYWWFKPAWGLEKDLQLAFEMQDPALTIVRWLRKFYPASPQKNVSTNSSLIHVKPGSVAAELISKVGKWVVDRAEPELRPLWRYMLENEECEEEKLLELAVKAKHAVFEEYIKGYCVEGVSGDQLRFILKLPFTDNADPHGPACITPQNFSKCIRTSSFEESQTDIRSDWKCFINNYKHFRMTQHGGRSPFSPADLEWMLQQLCWSVYGMSSLSVEFTVLINDFDIDSTILLTKLYEREPETCLYGKPEEVNRGIEFFYLPLIQQLREEGSLETSDALMAFSLFAIAKRYEGNLEQFNKLYTLLEAAALSPLSTLTQKSIEVARNISEQNHQTLTYEKLSHFTSTDQEEILRHIQALESGNREFKSTLRWDIARNCISEDPITHSVMKTIAAFINTEGGTLIIGVADDRTTITGLKHDYDKKQPDADKLCLWFNTRIKLYLKAEAMKYMPYHVARFRGEEVLVVKCLPGNQPIYCRQKVRSIQEDFFVRRGSESEKLTSFRDYEDFYKHRWP